MYRSWIVETDIRAAGGAGAGEEEEKSPIGLQQRGQFHLL